MTQQFDFRPIDSDDPSLAGNNQAIIKVSGHQHQWLRGGYDLEIGQFRCS